MEGVLLDFCVSKWLEDPWAEVLGWSVSPTSSEGSKEVVRHVGVEVEEVQVINKVPRLEITPNSRVTFSSLRA